jgi:hypothetical protein
MQGKAVQTNQTDQADQAGDFLKAYDFSTGVLRAWLGAYSVGVPAFLFTHDDVLKKLVAQHRAVYIAEIFALAVALQVAITFINKYIQWGVYSRHSPPRRINWYTNLCEKMSEWILVDALVDIATIVFLGWGSFLVFTSLLG